ncbi:MAG: DUF2752 domain-containing protein [Rikenellaceae bacterium]|nr:DUF2752 domain-containing protein [Rikenellaceae bacterium]
MDRPAGKKILLFLGIAAFAGLLILYGWVDPAINAYFPKCPLKLATGLDCPGCGSQRAVHNLLHLRVGKAFIENPLFVVAIPYIYGAVYFESRKAPTPRLLRWRQRLYGLNAIYFILIVIVLFTTLRNII